MHRSEEIQIIEAAGRGDRDAAAALVRAHQGGVYGYILRLSGRPDVAEDVTQDAFVRALTNLDRFDPRFRFSTWIFTIARRLYLNLIERKSARTGVEVDGRPRPSASTGTILAQDRDTVRDTLQRALMELSEEQREVVVLFHQHGWPIALVAQHLDMPVGTVKSHLHRGRQRLRDELEKQPAFRGSGIVPESWLTPGVPQSTEARA
jgi:RNA polymerase sigma-70 factor (ECF subfamily)